MDRYQNGKIYSIRSHQTDDVYIGSTCLSLAKRIYGHRADYNMWKKGTRHYVTSYDILTYNDNYIELLENYPCGGKNELLRREGQLIRTTENCKRG